MRMFEVYSMIVDIDSINLKIEALFLYDIRTSLLDRAEESAKYELKRIAELRTKTAFGTPLKEDIPLKTRGHV
jgi:hypothetical protein